LARAAWTIPRRSSGASVWAMSDRRLMALAGHVGRGGSPGAHQARHPPGVQARRHLPPPSFEAAGRPYLYSTYERPQEEETVGGVTGKIAVENEARPTGKKKIAILGGGPNRIGQGIEFDYCCVHAVQALRGGTATRRS